MKQMKRYDGRQPDQLRPVVITKDFIKYPEGSVLIQCGDTKVICNATVEEGVPPFKRDSGSGWVTAEYNMLPRATDTRNRRDISKLKLSPRSAEIQRLVGRALRSVTDLDALGERTITIDCDVIQADGGTRCASITGGFVALVLALDKLRREGAFQKLPVTGCVAAVSCGLLGEQPLLDLCYVEDSGADVDFNFVMDERDNIIEIQGTGEERPFSKQELDAMYQLAQQGIRQLVQAQKEAIGDLAVTFVLASNNLKKRREMGQILQAMGIQVLTMEEAGIHSEPEEDGSTFEENALIKARAACQAAGLPALADDSGLAVDALNGAPGIHSARYCPGSDRDRLLFLLKNMEQVPDGQRGAKFVSAVACVFPDGRELVCRGECPGQILREERGDGELWLRPGLLCARLWADVF